MKDFSYRDGRNTAPLRLEALDQGLVFEYGHGPEKSDFLGAREVWVFEADGLYHMTYDGAGPDGWLACLATSRDLVTWERHGPILDFGEANPALPDSGPQSNAPLKK